jgi:PAS domain S-box-containing protein
MELERRMHIMVDSLNDRPSGEAASEQTISQDHIALIYSSAEERLASTIPLVKVGLERGELCLYISDLEDDQGLVEALKAEHIDVEKAISTGGLILTSKQEVYFQLGRFDPDWTIRVIKNVAELAISYGFTAMRVISDMKWTQDDVPGVERWQEYEADLCTLDLGLRLRTICQYDRAELPPETLIHAVRTHPKLVCQGGVYDNIFFVPPARLQVGEGKAAELESMLASISAATSKESEMLSLERKLRDLSERLDGEARSRAAAEASLDESRDRFHAVCERSSDWVWEIGPDGTYVYSSPRSNDLLGMTSEEVIGRRPEDLVEQEDAARVSSTIAQAISDHASISALEKKVRHRDGRIIHLEMNGVSIRDRDGSFRGYRGIDKDITGRRASKKAIDEHRHKIEEMTAELNARDSRLKALEEEIGQLRGSISAKENAAAALTVALAEKEQEAGKLAGDIERLSAELSSLTAKLQQAGEASALDRKEMERHEAHQELLKFNIANLEADLVVQRARVRDLEAESQKALASHSEEIASKNKELEEASAALVAMRSEADDMKARLDAASVDLTAERERVQALEAKSQEALAALRDELTAKSNEYESATAEIATLREALTARDKELEAAAAALAAMGSEAGIVKVQLEAVSTELAAMRQEMGSLKASEAAKGEELSKLEEEVSVASSRVQQLTAEAEELRTQLAEKDAEIASKDAEISSKVAELSSKDADIQSKDAELNKRGEEITAAAARSQQLTAETEELRARLAEKDAEISSKQAELGNHRSRESDMMASLTSRDMEINMLKQRAETAGRESTRLAEELRVKGEELTALRVQLAAGQADSLNLKSEMAGMETSLAMAERELNAHREQLRALLRQDRVGVAHIDLDGRLVGANSAFHSLLGQDPGTLAGRHYRDQTYRDDLAASAELYRRLQAGEGSASMVKRYVRKHGGIATVSLTLSAVNGADGAPAYYMAMAYDRTGEAADDDGAAAVTQASTAPGAFSGDPALARRLNDVLTVISGSVTLAKEYVIPEGRMFGQLVQIEKATREAARLAAEVGGAPSDGTAAEGPVSPGLAKLVPGRGKVLLVDSDEAVLEATTDMLRHLGYDVDVARDGDEAAMVCRHASEAGAPFVLAIIDVGATGEEGKATASRLTSENRGLRTMASSGHAAHPAMTDPRGSGFSGSLPRPYTLEELSRAVGSVLSAQGKA